MAFNPGVAMHTGEVLSGFKVGDQLPRNLERAYKIGSHSY